MFISFFVFSKGMMLSHFFNSRKKEKKKTERKKKKGASICSNQYKSFHKNQVLLSLYNTLYKT